MKDQDTAHIPVRFFRLFLSTLNAEIGYETLTLFLEKSNLPADMADPQAVSRYTSTSAAEAYASIQQAMRTYYGRGARGTLTRIGRLLWPRLLETAAIHEKAQAQLVRTLPPAMRFKPAVEMLARFLREDPEGVTVHTLDLDLLFVDHAAPATVGQKEPAPVCYVTLGLLQEALFWASGREHDVEEISCRAHNGDSCEFKIILRTK